MTESLLVLIVILLVVRMIVQTQALDEIAAAIKRLERKDDK